MANEVVVLFMPNNNLGAEATMIVDVILRGVNSQTDVENMDPMAYLYISWSNLDVESARIIGIIQKTRSEDGRDKISVRKNGF